MNNRTKRMRLVTLLLLGQLILLVGYAIGSYWKDVTPPLTAISVSMGLVHATVVALLSWAFQLVYNDRV